MGLWNFVKDAGKSLFGADEDEKSADALQSEIKSLGLDAEGLNFDVDGDTVKVSGSAISDEIKEKVILAVGNIAGIAAVEDEVESEADMPVLHTVAKGDTLWAVSEKTLGNGSRYMEIFEANKPMLSHPDKIYPGQVLRIPK